MHGIILAGGSGSRLWPMSRELYPKQLISIDGKESLLQSTCKRLASFIPQENIVCVANIKHANDVKAQLKKSKAKIKLLCEPCAKNTAPAIAAALEYIKQNHNSDEIVLISPSDHIIKDNKNFKNTVENAKELANEGYIVTFGVKPTYIETGYGYIHANKSLLNGYEVDKFVEKPNYETAQEYVNSGEYYWNSGLFMGKVSVLIKEISRYSKEIGSNLKGYKFEETKPNTVTIPYSIFETMPSISFDYAVMEKTKKVALLELLSDWNDVGSWSSLYDIKNKDKTGNVIEGNVVTNNVKDSLIYSNKKLVAVSGVKNVIVVETEDAVMVCNKEQAQNVRQIYNKLEESNNDKKMVHKTVFRPWGYYTCLAEGNGYLTKMISVSPKQKLSIQSHNHRSEHWVVLEGKALVLLDGVENNLCTGESIDIPIKAKHSLQNPYEEELRIIEVQKGDYISEDDIIRYEDMYDRV